MSTGMDAILKACLAALPGGRKKLQRNRGIIANRLERWGLGERRSLWIEASRNASLDDDAAVDLVRRRVAVGLARLGLPGKAVQRLTGARIAQPTPEVEDAMRAKFPPPPFRQIVSSEPPATPCWELSEDDVLRAAQSFPKGSAPGPSGLRGDFLLQVFGEDGADHKPGVSLLAALVLLLANGRAPRGMQPYLGGAKGTALAKTNKQTGRADVRPICTGEVFLRAALPALREHLQPHHRAVGILAGAEVMPHLLPRWRGHFCGDTGRVCLAYDQSNAHNVVDRHAFLSRMQEVAPFIPPTNLRTCSTGTPSSFLLRVGNKVAP